MPARIALGQAVRKSEVRQFFSASIVVALVSLQCQSLVAASGTWINTSSGGLWSASSNWSGGIVADGVDATADFSTLDITADDTVHLDTPKTVGKLLFGDTTASNNWTVDNNGNSANSLNLAVSSGLPHLVLNNGTATINTVLTGNQGLAIGGGTFVLSGASTYSGGTSIGATQIMLNGSTVQSGGVITSGPMGTGSITFDSGGILMLGTSSGLTIANPIIVAGLGLPSLSWRNLSGTNTFSGNITLGGIPNVGKSLIIRVSTSNVNGELAITGNILANGTDTSAGLQIDDTISSGVLRLTGNNTYAGGTTVASSGGTLILDPAVPSNTVLGRGPLTVQGGNLQLRSSSAIANTPVTVTGGATLTLFGISSATDAASVNLSSSALNLAGPSKLPNIPYSVSLGTGLGSTVTLHASTINIGKNGTGIGTLTLGPLLEISNTGVTETFTGGAIILNSPASKFVAGTGVKLNSATTLSSNNATALGTGAALTLNGTGAIFNVGASQQILSLNGVAGTSVSLNPAGTPFQLTLGRGTFPGTITGSGGNINKVSTEPLIFSGQNNYTGITSVTAGALQVTGVLANNDSSTIFVTSGTDFTTASIVRRVLGGGSYTGLGSTAIAGALGVLGSSTDIRAGTNSGSSPIDMTMRWRFANSNDTPQLIADVLNLTGMSHTFSGHDQTDPFVLQMNYRASPLGALEGSLAARGLIDLAWLNTSVNQPNGDWQIATAGNFGVGLPGDVFGNVQGSWDTFAAAHGVTNANLGNFLGSYGVDITNHRVWAVINHNSQFSVVPEPSSLALAIGAGLAGLAVLRRGRNMRRTRLVFRL